MDIYWDYGGTGPQKNFIMIYWKRPSMLYLGKLNRGRGMMPGIGFIGGKLSIIGGYSWPGAVDIIEQWDEDK